MKKSDLKGTRQVFAFTLSQYFKNRSTIITLVTMFLLSAVMMCVIAFSADSTMDESGLHPDVDPSFPVHTVYLAVENHTSLPLDAADIEAAYGNSLLDVTLVTPDVPLEFDADTVRITVSQADGGYDLDYFVDDNASLTADELYWVESALLSAIDAAHYRALGISPDALSSADANIYASDMSVSEYRELISPDNTPNNTPDVLDPENGGLFALSYAYSIVVLMLVMFSASYIIRSVVEEKDSKLVELLMVSVKPLALILGKILATMIFVVAALAALLAGMGATAALIGSIGGTPSAIPNALTGLGIDLTMTLRVILTIPALLVSLLLAYFTFSLMGGVLGACCSKQEDTGAAVSTVTLITLASYLMTTVGSVSGSYGFAVFCSLCPFVSVFFAPVCYATGVIGFGLLALSWLLQAAIVVGLALFCARVYGALIIHRGNRIKLGALIKMARKGGGKA